MSPGRAILAVLVAAGLLAGCGDSGGDEAAATPSECLGGPAAFEQALADAPGEVTLDRGIAISDCVAAEQDAGALNQVGATVIRVATDLNAEARRRPGGRAAVELGYLVGSIEAGAGESGIHADLIRRLNAAARFNQGGAAMPAAFERAFGRGYAAAQASG